MAILFQQNRGDAWDSQQIDTSCTLTVDSPADETSYVNATINSASDSNDSAYKIISAAGKLPSGSQGRVAFRMKTGTLGTVVGNTTLFKLFRSGNPANTQEILSLYITTAKLLTVFADDTAISTAGFNTSTGVTLADNTEYLVEIAWIQNSYVKVWIDGKQVLNATGLSGGTAGRMVPDSLMYGIDHQDGAAGSGIGTMKYRNLMVSDSATERLLDQGTEPVVSNKGTKNEKAAAGSGNPTSVIGFTTDGGKALLVAVAIRRGGTISIGTPTLVDSAGNTYTYVGKSENATGAAGSAVALFYCNRARALYTAATTFTMTAASAFTALSLRVLELDVAAVTPTGALAAANGSSTAPSVTSGTPSTSKDRVWLGAHSTMNPNTTTDTISSTGYTASPVTTTMEGTSGGTAASNVATKLGYKTITNSATTQPYIGTLGTTGLWTAIIEGFEGTAAIDVTAAVADLVLPATVTDSFNRADANPITGYTASGMAGNTQAIMLKSNAVMRASAGAWACYDSTIGNVGDDQYGWITPVLIDAGAGGHAWVDLRITGEGSAATVDGYEVEAHRGNTPDDIIMWRTVNGAAVEVAKIAYPWTNGWSLGAAVVGSTVYALVNKNAGLGWQIILTWTDPSPLAPGSSKVGFGGNLDNSTTPTGGYIDEWSGGALTKKTDSAQFAITPTGAKDTQQSVNLTSAFTIAPTGTLDATVVDSGQIGPLTAAFTVGPVVGVREPHGDLSLTSAFTIAPTGQREALGAVNLTSAYTISPIGHNEPLGVAAITSTFTIAPTGTREPHGDLSLVSTFTVTADGDREAVDDAAITFAFSTSAAGQVESDITGAASIASTYVVAAAGNNEGVDSAAVSFSFGVAATGTREARASVNLPTTFTLAPTGHREALGRVNLTSAYTISPTGRREALGGAIVTTTFTIAPRGSIDVYGGASTSFDFTLTASGEEFAPTQFGAATVAAVFAIGVTGTYVRATQEELADRLLTIPFAAVRIAPRPGARGFTGGRGGARF